MSAIGSRIEDWWRARPPREKLLLAVVATGVLMACGDALFTAPLQKKLDRARAKTTQLAAQLKNTQATQQPAAGDSLQQQETALRRQLERARADGAALRSRLAHAARLPETLRAITATVGSARLLELDLSGEVESGGTPAAAGRRLHRLPITLKVAGSYAELQLLLSQIERHADALQWTSLTLDNAEWPAIQLTLKAHVLSTDPRWGASS